MMLDMVLFVSLAILLLVVLRPKGNDRGRDLSVDEILGPETASTDAGRDRPADRPPPPSPLGPDEATRGLYALAVRSDRHELAALGPDAATRRVYALRDRGEGLPVIAAILNAEGYRTAEGTEFLPVHVWQLLRQRKPYRQARGPERKPRHRLQVA